MTEISNVENQIPEFKRIIAGYSDNELRTVLKKRKLYQKEAADFAIQEAIKRGIIYSEQDLFAKEYKDEPVKFSLIPEIEDSKTREKFRKSILRALLILGAVPVIWGFLNLYQGNALVGISMVIYGLIWILILYQVKLEIRTFLVYLLYFMLIPAVAYLVFNFVKKHSLSGIDILIAFIAVGFVFYAVGFLSKLKD